jgi:sugar-specific transcriptional regulator TrmB
VTDDTGHDPTTDGGSEVDGTDGGSEVDGTDGDAVGVAGDAVPAESDAVAAFEGLGLTSYEAKVFIALQRIGVGTAREVSEVTDVPRSQVYSVTDSLAERGLVDVQQANPKRFRPVSVEAARSTLRDRFERESDRAFEFVERVQAEREKPQREEIWTIRGRDAVSDRMVELVGTADRHVLLALPSPALLTDEIDAAVSAAVEAGIAATVISEDPSVRERFADRATVVEPPSAFQGNDAGGRLVFADEDTLLLSVLESDGEETAVWSANSRFARVLIRLVEESLGV